VLGGVVDGVVAGVVGVGVAVCVGVDVAADGAVVAWLGDCSLVSVGGVEVQPAINPQLVTHISAIVRRIFTVAFPEI